MQKFKFSNSGETLIEVMIAISVMVLIMAPTSALNVQATRNNAYNRDHLIAENLAAEGLEIMRGIRDTNLLRFISKETACWNTEPEYKGEIDKCDGAGNLIEKGSYIIKEKIGSPDVELVLKDGDSLPDDFKPDENSEYQLKDDAGEPANFYREIYIEYSASKKIMFISSRVFFKNGAKIKKVTRITALNSILNNEENF